MKGLKKVLTGILASAMALSLTLSAGSAIKAYAEENNTTAASAATITINPTKEEGDSNYNPATSKKPTYKYYEMMYATIDGKKVSYYVDNQDLATALDGLKVENDDLFTVTQVGTTSKWIVAINKKADKTTEFSGEEVATALAKIKDKALVKGDTTNQTDTSVITLATQGYVLIESSLGSKMLADTFTTHTIYEKNGYPTSNKKQKIANGEATSADYYTADDVTAEIGKVVSYQVEVDIPESVAEKPITVVDTITKGLTLNTAVTVVGDVKNTYTSATFTLESTDTATGEKVYKLEVPKETVLANKNNTLKFQYTATVNKDAVIYNPEKNKAHIEYDNYATPDVEVKVYTYGFDLEKVDATNHDTKLEGVKFTLTNAAGEYYAGVDNTGNARFSSTKKELSTGTDGKISFNGLASGIYTLTETETKSGYNLLTAPITVIVSATGEISAAGFTVNKVTVNDKTVRVLVVENNSGLQLPSTGGIGTTIFYIIGGLLIVAAVVFFVVRRKADAE